MLCLCVCHRHKYAWVSVYCLTDINIFRLYYLSFLQQHAVNPDAQKLWQRVEERGTSVNLQTMFSRKSVHQAALGKVILLCERHCAEYYVRITLLTYKCISIMALVDASY